jgi:hypothetical protein
MFKYLKQKTVNLACFLVTQSLIEYAKTVLQKKLVK